MTGEAGAIEQLVKIGFTSYQAKVYASLVSLGVGSVSEIHRHSKVPRTKVYETLDELNRRGAVELQSGRPALYRVVHPKVLVGQLVEDYLESAKKANEALERSYQETNVAESDLAWTVKGAQAVRRKLAEIISSAGESVSMLETFPPTYTLSVAALLKTLRQRGVKVTTVSVIREDQLVNEYFESDLISYRVFRKRLSTVTKRPDMDVLIPLIETLSSPYGVAVVDRTIAFVIIPNLQDESRSIGLSAKIPGVPTILGMTIQKYVEEITRRARI